MSKNKYVCDCNLIHKEIVENTIKKQLDSSLIDKIANFYKIMGDYTRCKIISALLINKMCVCDLCNVLSMSKSSVSHQLTKMREAKVLKCERVGKEVYYSLEDEHVKNIFRTTEKHIKHEVL